MSFTAVNRNSTSSAGSATTLAIAVTGVSAGDFVFVWAGDGGSQAISGVSDGTTSLTGLTGDSEIDLNGRIFYLLASVATGTVTYTATFAAACTNRFIGAWVFTPSGAVTFDQQSITSPGTAVLDSGNITTTGTDVLCVAGDVNSAGVHTSLQIGGVAATDTDSDGLGAYWYRATTGTVAATGTATGATRNVTAIASFKIAGAAGNPFASSIGAQMIPVGKPNYQAMLCGFVLGTALTLSQGAQQVPVGKSVAFVPAQTRSASMTTLTHLQARPPYYQDIQPFNQTDWPLPRRPGTLLSVTINIRPPLDTPAAVVLPFSQTDWPLPQGKPYPLALRTWTQDRKQYYADIQPFNQTHWPPGRAMPPAPGLTTATSAAQQGVLSLPIGGIPTGAQMLALPLYKPPPSPTLLTWVQIPPPIATQSLGGLPPQINYDWPLPARAAVPPPTRLTHVSYYVYNTNLPSIPGTTFPLPYGKPYPIALRTWIQGTPRYYTDTVPFNQTEWPVPAPRPRPAGLTTWTQSLVLNTLSIVPGTPIVPALWPMPFSRRPMPPTWTQTPPNLATSTLGAPGWALLLGGERNRLVREMT